MPITRLGFGLASQNTKMELSLDNPSTVGDVHMQLMQMQLFLAEMCAAAVCNREKEVWVKPVKLATDGVLMRLFVLADLFKLRLDVLVLNKIKINSIKYPANSTYEGSDIVKWSDREDNGLRDNSTAISWKIAPDFCRDCVTRRVSRFL